MNRKLICFLGNTGARYQRSRHNLGWMLADYLWRQEAWKEKFNGLYLSQGQLTLLKPRTMMNRSGQSVQAALSFFKLEPEDLLVVHDDLELSFGDFAWKKGGGLAGHNGLKSIEQHLKSRNFLRLRMGIGRPSRAPVASWVLQPFDSIEEARLEDFLAQTGKSLQDWVRNDCKESSNT